MLTRESCHLCEEAITVVQAVCQELDVGWHPVDVDTDPELQRRYSDQVPVTFVDGRQHDFWRVDPDRLRTALRRPG